MNMHWTIKKAEPQRIDVFELWCWRRLFESPLDCKEIQPVHPKGDQSWVFIGWTDAKAETPVLWPPHAKSWLKLISIELMMPSNHLILCRPLLLPPSIFPSIRVLFSESVLHIRQPKCWSFSFSISPSSEYSRLISFKVDWLDLLAVQGTLKESSPTPQFKSINSSVLSLLHSPTLTSIHDHRKNHSLD